MRYKFYSWYNLIMQDTILGTLKTIDSTTDFPVVFSCNSQVQNEMLQIFWNVDALKM